MTGFLLQWPYFSVLRIKSEALFLMMTRTFYGGSPSHLPRSVMSRVSLSLFLVVTALTVPLATSGWAASPMQQASDLYNAKQFAQAISILEPLYLESPEDASVINNLAANYISRGVTINNTQKDVQAAANDFRRALYILRYEWPSDLSKTPLAQKNEASAEANLNEALVGIKAPIKDVNWHLGQAKALRSKGLLPEAFIEYASAAKLQNLNTAAWEGQGDIYTVRRRYDKALSAYQQAIYAAGETRSSALQVKLATAYQHMNQPDKAATIFAQVLDTDPSNTDALMAMEQLWIAELRVNPNNNAAHINLGTVYERMKRFPEAEREYQDAFKRDPNNRQLKLNFASLAMAQGNTQRALTIYDDLLATSPNDSALLEAKATLLAKQGQGGAALEQYKRLLATSSDPDSVIEAMLKTAEGNPRAQAETWQTIAAARPQDAKTQYDAGLVFHQQQQYDSAIRYYQAATRLNPNFAEAYANLGSAYSATNKPKEAQAALAKALSLNPNLKEAQALNTSLASADTQEKVQQAVSALNTERYPEAVSRYAELVQKNPQQADFQAQYGLALQGNNQLDAAMAAFNQAIKLDAKRGDFHYYKGRLLEAQQNLPSAKSSYETALKLDPKLKDAELAMQELAQRLGQQAEAERVAQINQTLNDMVKAHTAQDFSKTQQLADSLLKQAPGDAYLEANAQAHYYKGLALEGLNQPQKALGEYQAATRQKANFPDAWYAQAVLLDTQGQPTQAKAAFQSFLKHAEAQGQRDDEYTQYARERVTQL
jgi:tetratricopeptide (TPR) repeat protein